MIFKQVFDHKSSTYTYLIASSAGREALIIDPVSENVEDYIKLLNNAHLWQCHAYRVDACPRRYELTIFLCNPHAVGAHHHPSESGAMVCACAAPGDGCTGKL